MSQTPLSYKEILHRPPPTLGERLPPSLRWAAIGAGVGFGVTVVAYAAKGAWAVLSEGVSVPDWRRIALSCLAWTVVFAVLGFVWKFLAMSRRLLDRSFYSFALIVTLVGFGMLVWFMGALVIQSYEWFQVMQPKIHARNEELSKKLKAMETAEKTRRAEVELEINDATKDEPDPAKKAEIRKQYEDALKEELAANAKAQGMDREINEKQIRPDPNAGNMFWHFISSGASDEANPQDAGIFFALVGSVMIGIITLVFAVPLGVGAAIYLEEYRAKGWINKLIQVNITNLAAVPSVFYGIMGAFIFVELTFKNLQGEMWTPAILSWIVGESNAKAVMQAVFGDKIHARNLLGGGLSLAMLTLPVVIVASQEAIRAVPQSLRHGALALGATKWQSIWHHVIPQARSGILTGIILSLSRAIGEAAPLVMFGAFMLVTATPKLLTDFTVMPMQIFNWSERSEAAWKYNTALASLVLMVTLLLLNAAAIWMRQRARRALKAA
jgi:phosphate transport system permease protein